jgi:RNA polymerase sigma-70 factor, ECF subfamily
MSAAHGENPHPLDKEKQLQSAAALAHNEALLINRIKAGEKKLFVELIRPYERNLHLACLAILQSPADVQEVVQETLLKALSHIGQLRTGECFRSWLLQIAINEARMRQRKDRKYLYDSIEQNLQESESRDFKPRSYVDWREIPSETLERKEFREAIARALASLSDIYRNVFVLRDIQYLNISQTAAALGISEAAVTTRLHRARLQMREQLAPLFRQPHAPWRPVSMIVEMGKRYMQRTINCQHVVRELSRYIDGELDSVLSAQVEKHLRLCHRCSILLDTTRKMLRIVADERTIEIPVPDYPRLEQLFLQRAKPA